MSVGQSRKQIFPYNSPPDLENYALSNLSKTIQLYRQDPALDPKFSKTKNNSKRIKVNQDGGEKYNPQGSILGPYIMALYINSMHKFKQSALFPIRMMPNFIGQSADQTTGSAFKKI